jgi:predicted nicotinamide N-methyase
LFEETIVSYPITKRLSISLIELRNVQPYFSRYPYCGANAFWYLVWPASLALSRHVAKAFPVEYWQGKRVLVIGCGVGLESVTLAKLGAEVTALDHVPEALQLVQRNCQQNALPPVRTLWHCWWDANSTQQLGQYDVVIGSDVLYEAADGVRLQKLLTITLKSGGMGFFADPQRASAQAFLARLESSGFQVQVHQGHTQWGSGREEVRMYQVDNQK